jgi:succinate dehydrogenase / fumarate reductase flavoprotein subunit
MQGLADGYFVIPNTIASYLATLKPGTAPKTDGSEFAQAEENVRGITRRLLGAKGKRTVQSFHKELGKIMWDHCGMGRTKAGLEEALRLIPALREEYWQNVNVPGSDNDLNQALERAGRVADFFELGELLCRDALEREESCGGHFREEHQFPDGEARRDDENFAHVAVWEYQGDGNAPLRNVEPLVYEEVKMVTRSYK